jgi:hypothetical protein
MKLENTGSKYLRDDGTWQAVAGGAHDALTLGATLTDVLSLSAQALSAVAATADNLAMWDNTANKLTYAGLPVGVTLNAGSLTLGAITPTSVNGLTLTAAATGFTIVGGTTPKTLTVGLDASVSGTNTGDQTIKRTLTFDFDGGGSAISEGTAAMIRLPFGFQANSWSLVGSANDRAGAAAACVITLMVYVDDWSTSAFPTTDVVGAGTDPALSAATGATAATNWDDESWASGQLIMVKSSGTPTAKWATLTIEGTEI